MSGIRVKKVAHQIQKEISQILIKDIQDPNLGLVTITQVKITPDLRQAKIFYSVYGTAEEIEKNKKVLLRSTPYIRCLLGKRIKLRYTPEINFVFDDTPEKADRIFNIIERLKQDKGKDDEKVADDAGHTEDNR